MTAPQPWERGTFNKPLWQGDKPIAEPDPKGTPLDLLGIAWERKPDDPDADYHPRGGIIVALDEDEDGQQKVTCLNSRGRNGRPRVVLYHLKGDDVEPSTVVAPSHSALSKAVRCICRDLGAATDGARLTRSEIDLLGLAFRLVGVDMHAYDEARTA